MIPTRRSPRKPRALSTIVTISPKTTTRIGQVVKLPSATGVPSPRTTIPEFTRPMKAMKSPMPIAIAFFSSSGMGRAPAGAATIKTTSGPVLPRRERRLAGS
jgi:hypothetical protein